MSEQSTSIYRLTPTQFTGAFVALALISGVTIGMNKILVTLLALHLDLQSWQIGVLFGAESLSMMMFSLPAGIYISKHGARGVYFIASIGAMILYPLIANAGSWYVAALLLALAGICIPFRVASMNTSWLERLPEVGKHRSGWYRGTLMLGIGLLGPLIGNWADAKLGMHGCYWITSGMFGFMAFYGLIVLSNYAATRQQSTRQGFHEMFGQLSDPVVREVCTYDGMGGIVRGFFGTFIIILAVRQFHWTTQAGIWLIVAEGATFVAVLLFFGSVVERLGEQRTYTFSHATLIIGLLFLGLSDNIIGLYIGAFLQGSGQAFNHLVNVSRLAHSGRNMGHVSGLFTMVGMGGGFLGAMLGGLFSEGIALQDVFLLWIPIWLAVTPGFRTFLIRLISRPA